MRKFYISAYNGELDGLGIFLYDEQVFFFDLDDHQKGTHDFRFKLEYTILDYNNLKMRGNPSEKLDFVHCCDLENFIKVENIQPGTRRHKLYNGEGGKPVLHKEFDYEKLVSTAVPNLYEFVKNRLVRKLSNVIPEPVIFTSHHWGEGSEFLQVDEFTSFAGNFEQDGKEGCCMDFGPTNNDLQFYTLNIETDWSSWDLPVNFQKEIGSCHYNDILEWSKERKAEYFNNFPLDLKQDLAIRSAKRYIEYQREPSYFPYKIYLYGTDDCSYSKWFTEESKMLEEVNYLRKMQPLNLQRDLLDRDFVFTN